MNCEMIREQLPDLALGSASTSEVNQHLTECKACAAELVELRKTMALLDEWQAPEPSPYFDTRMQALLREEREKKTSTGWFAWLRRPAFGIAAVALLALGIGVYEGASNRPNPQQAPANNNTTVAVQSGTAVGDLEFLDKHAQVLQDFGDDDDTQNY